MPDLKPRLLKGFRDYLPEIQLPKERMLRKVATVFESFGYAPLATPALEYAEILAGKCGEEGDKLLYRFEDHGGRKVAMRYDLTVPLARVLAQYGDLELPFRRYQIGPVWRAEKPARGRFREFVQCDADIAGTTSLLADVEVIQVACRVLEALGVDGFRIRVSNRKVLGGLLEGIGIAEGSRGMGVIRTIDKLDKAGLDGVERLLSEENGLGEPEVARVLEFLRGKEAGAEATLDAAERYFEGVEIGREGVGEIREVLALAAPAGIADRIRVDLTLARGMDYYTGTIAEGVLTDLPGFGSVLGGGRYDELVGVFRGSPIPAVGISLGVDRLLAGLLELELVEAERTPSRVLVSLFDRDSAAESVRAADELRGAGLCVELAPEPTKLSKQFRLADRKGIPLVVVLGPDEIAAGEAAVKDLRRGTQETVDRSALATHLAERLRDFQPAPN